MEMMMLKVDSKRMIHMIKNDIHLLGDDNRELGKHDIPDSLFHMDQR